LFIIIYVNVCVKRVYPHKTNNNILFRNGKMAESQFSVPWSSLRWSNWAFKSPAVFNCAVNKSKQFTILKIWIFTRTSMTVSEQWVWFRLEWLTRRLQTILMCLE